MDVFELHFNPKAKEAVLFESFVYEPENSAEERLGSLYIVSQLNNALPQHSKFLNNLADIIKREYYYSLQRSSEQSLKEALKKANEFLSQKAKKGDVSWLGNIQLAILTLSPKSLGADLSLNFTKLGDCKILLLRAGQVFDIGKNLDSQEIEPYPLRVFGNIVTGKAVQGDKILMLTDKVFQTFEVEKITQKIANVLEAKQIKKIFKNKEDVLKEISGICVLINITPKTLSKQSLSFEKEAWKFKIPKLPQLQLPKIRFSVPKIKMPGPGRPTFPPIKQKLTLSFSKNKQGIKKNLILIFSLIIILALGSFIFKKQQSEKIKNFQDKIESIKEKTIQAESFLIIKEQDRANILLQEALAEILPLTKEESGQKEEILTLKNSIEKQLEELNKIQKIDNPQIYSGSFPKKQELKPTNLKPLPAGFKADLVCSFHSNLYFLDKKYGAIIKYPYLGDSKWGDPQLWLKPCERAVQAKDIAIDGSIWILTKDNTIDRYHTGTYKETLPLNFYPKLEEPTKIFTNSQLAELYILEPIKKRIIIINKKGEIIKQYQSDKFDRLEDFAVSENGKTIYLLNRSTVYQIQL